MKLKLKLTIVALMGFGVLSASAANASEFSQFLHHSNVYVGVNNGGGPYGYNRPYGYGGYNNPPCHGHHYQPAPVPYYVPVPGPAYPPAPSYDFNPSVIPPAVGWNQFGNSGYSPNQFANQSPPQDAQLQYVPGHYELRN